LEILIFYILANILFCAFILLIIYSAYLAIKKKKDIKFWTRSFLIAGIGCVFFLGISLMGGVSGIASDVFKEQQSVSRAEIEEFLEKDKTDVFVNKVSDLLRYLPIPLDCDFAAASLLRNAKNQGFRAGVADVQFSGIWWGHMMVAFETKDKGKIFVEPYTDEIIEQGSTQLLINGEFYTVNYRIFDNDLGRSYYVTFKDYPYEISIFDDNRDGKIDDFLRDHVIVSDNDNDINIHISPPISKDDSARGSVDVGDIFGIKLIPESVNQLLKEAESITWQLTAVK